VFDKWHFINKRLTVNIFQSENELLLETTLTVNKIKIKFHYKQNGLTWNGMPKPILCSHVIGTNEYMQS
jgi:hypothetical protein